MTPLSILNDKSLVLPDCPQAAEFKALVEEIRATTAALERLKESLTKMPQRMAQAMPRAQEREQSARYLYWTCPDLRATDLAKAFFQTDVHHLLERIGPVKSRVSCTRCRELIEFRSRAHMDQVRASVNARGVRFGDALQCSRCNPTNTMEAV